VAGGGAVVAGGDYGVWQLGLPGLEPGGDFDVDRHFFSAAVGCGYLRSFPTRRSSDLEGAGPVAVGRVEGGVVEHRGEVVRGADEAGSGAAGAPAAHESESLACLRDRLVDRLAGRDLRAGVDGGGGGAGGGRGGRGGRW